MTAYLLPQNDDRERRAAELAAAASKYTYNTDIGIPLIDAEGPDDANKLDWKVKIFALLLRLRKNVQAICDKSGLKFQETKPVRDIHKLLSVIRRTTGPNRSVTTWIKSSLTAIRIIGAQPLSLRWPIFGIQI